MCRSHNISVPTCYKFVIYLEFLVPIIDNWMKNEIIENNIIFVFNQIRITAR